MEHRADIEKLAALSRLALPKEDNTALLRDIVAILSYVSEILKASAGKEKNEKPLHRNVLREESDPHPSGMYTKRLLAAAPASEGGFVKVKKILAKKGT